MTGSRKGYTLVELMITVAIIGILAASAMVIFANFLEKSLEGATKANLGTIMSAVSIYYSDNTGKWPQDITAASFKTYLPSSGGEGETYPFPAINYPAPPRSSAL